MLKLGTGPFQDLWDFRHECLPLGACSSDEAGAGYGLRISGSIDMSVSCWTLDLRTMADCGCNRLDPSYKAFWNLQSDWVGWAYLQWLLDCG